MKRIASIDIAKGITILLVVIGHTLSFEARDIVREFIYSFHMPLFFVLSGYTSHYSTNLAEVRTRSRHLFKKLAVPMMLLWLVFGIYSYIFKFSNYTSFGNFITQNLLQLFYASGVRSSQLAILGGGDIESVGFLWFFAALITATIIYDITQVYFKGKTLFFITLCLSTAGIVMGQFYHFPLGLDTALAVVMFLWVGQQLKKYNLKFEGKKFTIIFLCWLSIIILIRMMGSWHFEIAHRKYPLFPLCIMGGIFGTIALVYLCDILGRKINFITSQLILFGSCSLNILVIHCLDFLWEDLYMVSDYVWLNVALRLTFVLAIFYFYRMAKSRWNLLDKIKLLKIWI